MIARLVISALVSLLAAPALAQSDGELSPEELQAIEDALAADAEDAEGSATTAAPAMPRGRAAAQSMNPNIALILDVAAAYYSEEDSLQLGGHDPIDTGFTLQQLELHFDASVDPFFRLDANLVFALFGVEVEEVFATTTALPGGLQMRIGQFLTAFGRLNGTHPHSWSFADQPLVNGKFFGSEGSRGLGLELSWLTPLPWYVEVLGSVHNADGACCARSYYGADNPGIDGFEDLLFTTTLNQFFDFSRDWSLLWGLSGQFGPNSTGHLNRTHIYGTDLHLRFKPLDSARGSSVSLQTEVMFRTRQVPDDVLQDVGLYTQLVYNITRRWEVGARYEWVQGVEADPLDPEWSSTRARTTAQVTFYPSHFSRLRLQGKYDRPEWTPRPIWGTVLAAEFLIGAHGAHSY